MADTIPCSVIPENGKKHHAATEVGSTVAVGDEECTNKETKTEHIGCMVKFAERTKVVLVNGLI